MGPKKRKNETSSPKKNATKKTNKNTQISSNNNEDLIVDKVKWKEIKDSTNIKYKLGKYTHLKFKEVNHHSEQYIRISTLLYVLECTSQKQLDLFINKMNSKVQNKYDYSFFILYLSYHFFNLRRRKGLNY